LFNVKSIDHFFKNDVSTFSDKTLGEGRAKMCWPPSLQKPFEYFQTKPLEKFGKKEVVYIPMEWIPSHVLFLSHFQHKLHQNTKFGSKSKSPKNIIQGFG
jgi:hypothetical protein